MPPLAPAEKKGSCGSSLAISNIDLLIESFINACIPVAALKLPEVKTTSFSSLNTSFVKSKYVVAIIIYL